MYTWKAVSEAFTVLSQVLLSGVGCGASRERHAEAIRLIARLDDTGQIGGLLEILGEDASAVLVVLGMVVICTRGSSKARRSVATKEETNQECGRVL